MSSKLNVWGVVQDHLRTLKNLDTERYSPGDILVLFGVPVLIAAALVWRGVKVTDQMVSVLITALSVFAGLLFNLLLLIYDIVQKDQGLAPSTKLQRQFLKEIYANISFCILTSIMAIVCLSVYSFGVLAAVVSVLVFVVYLLLAVFLLTLLMVLKRVHVLLSKEFSAKV